LWNLNYAYDKAQNKAQNKAQKSMMSDREHLLLLLKENPSLTQAELSEMDQWPWNNKNQYFSSF